MLITKGDRAANIHKLRFEIQKCALNATAKHNRAIVCTSCYRSSTLQYTQAVFLHRIGPNISVHNLSERQWISSRGLVSRTPRISCVREAGTFLELAAIEKGAPYFHSVLWSGVNKHRPVTSTSTDVATSAKTSPFLIAVREG